MVLKMKRSGQTRVSAFSTYQGPILEFCFFEFATAICAHPLETSGPDLDKDWRERLGCALCEFHLFFPLYLVLFFPAGVEPQIPHMQLSNFTPTPPTPPTPPQPHPTQLNPTPTPVLNLAIPAEMAHPPPTPPPPTPIVINQTESYHTMRFLISVSRDSQISKPSTACLKPGAVSTQVSHHQNLVVKLPTHMHVGKSTGGRANFWLAPYQPSPSQVCIA